MKRILLFFFALSIACINFLQSEEKISERNDSMNDKPNFHFIRDMFPESWNFIPLINPKLPPKYAADFFDNLADLKVDNPAVLWGVKEDIEAFKKNVNSKLSSPIFTLMYSIGVAQTGQTSFSQYDVEIYQEFRRAGMQNIKINNLTWGSYPIKSIQFTLPNNKKMRIAWIGLNQDGHVMIVGFFESPLIGEKMNEQIWQNFLTGTTQLEERELFLASGSDLREGYTFYQIFIKKAPSIL